MNEWQMSLAVVKDDVPRWQIRRLVAGWLLEKWWQESWWQGGFIWSGFIWKSASWSFGSWDQLLDFLEGPEGMGLPASEFAVKEPA